MHSTQKSSRNERGSQSQPRNVSQTRLRSRIFYSILGQHLLKHNNQVYDWRYVAKRVHDRAWPSFLLCHDHWRGTWEISSHRHHAYSHQRSFTWTAWHENHHFICYFVGPKIFGLLQWRAYHQYPWKKISCWHLLHDQPISKLYIGQRCHNPSDSSHSRKRRYFMLHDRSGRDRRGHWGNK